MKLFILPVAMGLVAALGANGAEAAVFSPTFTYVGADTTNAQDSGVYKANLTGFPGLTSIASITITDDNSGTSGSPAAYSGFDLDALFLDDDRDIRQQEISIRHIFDFQCRHNPTWHIKPI